VVSGSRRRPPWLASTRLEIGRLVLAAHASRYTAASLRNSLGSTDEGAVMTIREMAETIPSTAAGESPGIDRDVATARRGCLSLDRDRPQWLINSQ
jgi:hypothetical protein